MNGFAGYYQRRSQPGVAHVRANNAGWREEDRVDAKAGFTLDLILQTGVGASVDFIPEA